MGWFVMIYRRDGKALHSAQARGRSEQGERADRLTAVTCLTRGKQRRAVTVSNEPKGAVRQQ